MAVVFFIILTFFLIVTQTVIPPSFPWFVQCFDLLIIDILFLSLISSHYSIIFAIVVIGCVMDSVSGVPFSYHIFSYLWIYFIVQIVKQLLFKRSIMFILIISVASVFIQHILLLLSIFINQGSNAILEINFGLLVRQVFWGFVFIPSGIWLANILWRNWIFMTRFLQNRLFKNTEGSIERI